MNRLLPLLASAVVLAAAGGATAQTLTTLYDFGADARDGEDPQYGVAFDRDGNLWGAATLGGGPNAEGTLFRLVPPAEPGGAWTEETIHRFRGEPGGDTPECRLVVTPNGQLFGTTYLGGAHDMGTVFQAIPPLAPDGRWIVRALYSFGATPGDGLNPNAGLTPASGVLYGVTSTGGAQNRGTVFSIRPPEEPGGAWVKTTLYGFRALPDAAFPSGEVAIDANGNIYGNALQGGANNLGAVYQLTPPDLPGGRWTETVLHSFDGTHGTLPAGRLIFDTDGAIYGTTAGGGPQQGGTVFKLTPPAIPGDPWTHEVIFAFTGGMGGGSPDAGVTMDALGRLFGTTESGGSGRPNPGGVVFMLTPPAEPGGVWTETVLHAFGGNDGFRPIAPVILRGNALFSTTAQGGAFGEGTAFRLTLPPD